jgi:hypothetical protein
LYSEVLERLTQIAETLYEGKGQLARAYFKLTRLHEERDGSATTKSHTYAGEAVQLRSLLRPELADAPFEEGEFLKLCPWMLW